MNDLQEIIECLSELQEDGTVPRNVKTKIAECLTLMEGEGEISMKISKIMNHLDDLADDSNMEPYTRTQIWNVVSMLERV